VAVGTVIATRSHASSGPGRSTSVAYQESVANLPVTVTASLKPIYGDVVVRYDDGNDSTAEFNGTVPNASTGEIVRLYAQRFPYKSAPVPVGSLTLNPASGNAYKFRATPVVATRYQAMLFASATSSTPLATSVISTIYVLGSSSTVGDTGCVGTPVCHATLTLVVHDPAAGIQAGLARRWYAYLGITLGPAGQNAAAPTSMQLGLGNAAITNVHRISQDSLGYTFTFSYNVGNDAYSLQYVSCQRALSPRTA